jgi:SAM-dependent methyltransferase
VDEPGHLTATRTGYDAIAEQYATTFQDPLAGCPLDRGLLAGFAELVRRDHSSPQVLEVGSGPGDITAHLHRLGLNIRGVDLSPNMVAIARRNYPELSFEVGEMSALDVPDAGLAAVVCWYSLIHIPPAERPAVLSEFCRVLRPGGYLLLAFQVGDGILHFDEAFGHEVNLDFHRLDPDAVVALAQAAGLRIEAKMVRASERNRVAAPVPQGFVIARAPRSEPAQ